MTRADRFFVSFDKTPIHYEFYDKPVSHLHAKGNVVILHGAGEYADRYSALASFLKTKGFRSYAMDHRGYGQSGGTRSYAKHLSDYGRDIDAVIKLIQKKYSGPTFILGHSFGGLIAAHAIARTLTQPVQGLILSCPSFGLTLKIPFHLKLAALIASVVAPKTRFDTPPHPEDLTHDKQVIEVYNADKQLTRFITAKLYALIREAFDQYDDIAANIECPTLLLQASDDRITDRNKARLFFEMLKSSDKTFKVYEGFYHEILQEVDKQKVFDDIHAWLEEKI